MTLASISPALVPHLIGWVADHPVWSLAILFVPTLLFGWAVLRRGLGLPPLYRWALTSVSAAAILLYGYVAMTYCQTPQFLDRIEPQVAAVSCLLWRGEPVYQAPSAADQYSMVYGPYTYVWVAGFYWLANPSIFAAKAAGVASCLAGVMLLLAALKRSAGWWTAIPCTALATTLYCRFDNDSFWCRADSHEVFLVSLSVFALTLSNPWIAAALVGISAGVCVNLKFTAAAYFLPIGTAFLLRYRRWGPAALAVAFSILAVAAPFLAPEISLSNYLALVGAVSHHPLSGKELRVTLQFAAWMAGILLILGFPSVRSARSADRQVKLHWYWTAAALGAAIVVTVPFAAKYGAGPHHLMPMLPILVWLVACSWSIANSSAPSQASPRLAMRHLVILPILVVSLVFSGAAAYSILDQLRIGKSTSLAIIIDLGRIMDALPGHTIEMGVGNDLKYEVTYLRPVLVFAGNPFHLDPAAAMDSGEAQNGLPAATAELCRSGLSEYILIPKSTRPYTAHRWYPGIHLIFSPQFAQAFGDNYQLQFSSFFFDVYARNSIAGAPKVQSTQP